MPKIFAYLPILLLPAFLLRIPLGNHGTTNVLDLLLIASLLYFSIILLKKHAPSELARVLRGKTALIASLAMIFVGFLLSYSFNFTLANWNDGLGMIKSFLVLPILFAFAVFFSLEKNILSKDGLLVPIFCLSAFLGFAGYLSAIAGKLTFDGRLALFFGSPNELAMLLGPGFLAGIALLGKIKSPLKLFFIYLGIAACSFSLFLTYSQGAWLALAVSLSLLFYFATNFRFGLLPRMFLLLSIIISSLVLFLSLQISDFVGHQEQIPPTPTDSRIMIYSVNQLMLANNWLWGIGPGNYQFEYLERQEDFSPFPQWAVPHAHNNLMHFFIEGGLLSFLGFLGMLCFLFLKTKKPSAGFFAIVIFLLFQGIFDTTIWRNDTAVLWWLAALLSTSSNGKSI